MSEEKFWLNRAVDEIERQSPEGEIRLSSGFGPSGIFHLGHMREVLTVDALAWGLKQRGRQVRHLLFLDDMDGFRKVPVNVDPAYEKYLGMPVYMVPAPDGSDKSYADYFFDEFKQSIDALGVELEVIKLHEEYAEGKFTSLITKTLKTSDKVRRIIEEVSHRQLKKDWMPVQILSDNHRLDEWTFKSFDEKSKTVSYLDKEGKPGKISYLDGRVKLNWRIDWPARWTLYDINVEPFGRDHATKGGSYDTGAAIIRQVFDHEPPMPYPYEFVLLSGQTKKMSASSGTGLLPSDMLKIMPPALLRYLLTKNRPGLAIYIDVGQGFGKMFDEYESLQRDVREGTDNTYKMAYQLSVSGVEEPVLSNVPYAHLVESWQSARGDHERAYEILKRWVESNQDLVAGELKKEDLKIEMGYVDAWLEQWAPDEVKFSVQDKVKGVELSDKQKQLLNELAGAVEDEEHPDGQWFHAKLYELKEKYDLQPKEVFVAVYRVILGQDSGPKAGWFLSSFEKSWLVKRLRLEG